MKKNVVMVSFFALYWVLYSLFSVLVINEMNEWNEVYLKVNIESNKQYNHLFVSLGCLCLTTKSLLKGIFVGEYKKGLRFFLRLLDFCGWVSIFAVAVFYCDVPCISSIILYASSTCTLLDMFFRLKIK